MESQELNATTKAAGQGLWWWGPSPTVPKWGRWGLAVVARIMHCLMITRQVLSGKANPKSSQEISPHIHRSGHRSKSGSAGPMTRHGCGSSATGAIAQMGAKQLSCSLKQLPKERSQSLLGSSWRDVWDHSVQVHQRKRDSPQLRYP